MMRKLGWTCIAEIQIVAKGENCEVYTYMQDIVKMDIMIIKVWVNVSSV